MGAGHSYAVIAIAQYPQHLGVFINLVSPFACQFQFGIIFFYGCRDDNRIHIRAEIADTVADFYIGTKLTEPVCNAAGCLVRAGYNCLILY